MNREARLRRVRRIAKGSTIVFLVLAAIAFVLVEKQQFIAGWFAIAAFGVFMVAAFAANRVEDLEAGL